MRLSQNPWYSPIHACAAASGSDLSDSQWSRPASAAVTRPGLLEDLDVLRDGVERHVEWPREIGHLELALGREAPDDGTARTIGERPIYTVQPRNINHSVEY